ncbi:MAG: dephospho-CoA kinase [Thermoleophilaceae bacterium]|nr:dephospho-CoA kinase [Thermoleophilaceae bacterium]
MGLTGGMGAGKSEALRALERLGAATLSTDAVVHELLATDEVRDAVVGKFGESVVRDGALDRGLIAERVFGDEEARKALEAELWPRVGARVAAFREEGEGRALVVEVPLLFEAGMQTVFDKTVAVIADGDVRAARVGERDHESREGIQLSQQEKAELADFVIRNDGTIQELEQKLSEVLATMTT